MDVTHIIGPATGATYEAHDTGDTWNGNPVLAFTMSELLSLIRAGDGADANGYGLHYRDGDIVDIVPDDVVPVPTLIADVRGDTLVLYVPEGRVWDTEPDDRP